MLEFASGAIVTLGASWDVWAHRHGHMELYGSEGTLFLPDPNWFGGIVEVAGPDGTTRRPGHADHPFSRPNHGRPEPTLANYRTAGLADMALAIIEGREARCGLDQALHGIEVMTAILQSAETGGFVDLRTTCSRPASPPAPMATGRNSAGCPTAEPPRSPCRPATDPPGAPFPSPTSAPGA